MQSLAYIVDRIPQVDKLISHLEKLEKIEFLEKTAYKKLEFSEEYHNREDIQDDSIDEKSILHRAVFMLFPIGGRNQIMCHLVRQFVDSLPLGHDVVKCFLLVSNDAYIDTNRLEYFKLHLGQDVQVAVLNFNKIPSE